MTCPCCGEQTLDSHVVSRTLSGAPIYNCPSVAASNAIEGRTRARALAMALADRPPEPVRASPTGVAHWLALEAEARARNAQADQELAAMRARRLARRVETPAAAPATAPAPKPADQHYGPLVMIPLWLGVVLVGITCGRGAYDLIAWAARLVGIPW